MSNNTISYNGFYKQFLQPVFTARFAPPDPARKEEYAEPKQQLFAQSDRVGALGLLRCLFRIQLAR